MLIISFKFCTPSTSIVSFAMIPQTSISRLSAYMMGGNQTPVLVRGIRKYLGIIKVEILNLGRHLGQGHLFYQT